MAQPTAGDNGGGRSVAIFVVVGLVFVGLFFGGAQLLKMRNEEVAVSNTGQGQPAENDGEPQPDNDTPPAQDDEQPPASPPQEDPQPQEEERPPAPAPSAPEDNQPPAEDTPATTPENNDDPDQVATTGPSDDTTPPVAGTSDENIPATGPAEDLALMVGTMTLIGFGIHRLRQSKLAMMPRA